MLAIGRTQVNTQWLNGSSRASLPSPAWDSWPSFGARGNHTRGSARQAHGLASPHRTRQRATGSLP